MLVRRWLHAEGLRYRLHAEGLPGRPDLTFPKYRLTIFVNGCFWHRHGCKNSRLPQQNAQYWTRKLEKNVRKDEEHRSRLEEQGWRVLTLWECELNQASVVASVLRLISQEHA